MCAFVGAFLLASAAAQSVDVWLSAAACCYMFTLVGAYLLVFAVAHVLVPAWLPAAAPCYLIALVGAFLLVSAFFYAFVEMWQQAAAARGCHIAFWAKATPRVDVGDTPKTMTTASSRCGLWLGNLDKVGKGQKGDKEKDEEKEVVCTASSSFPVFLRTLSGRTVVLTAVGSSIPDLLQRVGKSLRFLSIIGTAMSMGRLCPLTLLHIVCIETALSSCALG